MCTYRGLCVLLHSHMRTVFWILMQALALKLILFLTEPSKRKRKKMLTHQQHQTVTLVNGRAWDASNWFYERQFTEVMKGDVHLITDSEHHWTFFQRLHTSHLLTCFTSSARCSGSDFMIWSNSANWGKHRHMLWFISLHLWGSHVHQLNETVWRL